MGSNDDPADRIKDPPERPSRKKRANFHHAKRASGLRNRYRNRGKGPYKSKDKSRSADYYGEWDKGHCLVPEKIGGRTVVITRTRVQSAPTERARHS